MVPKAAWGLWEQNRAAFSGRSKVREGQGGSQDNLKGNKVTYAKQSSGLGRGPELKASPAVAYGQVRSRGETWQETEAGALLSEDRGAEETHLESVQGVLTWPPLPAPGHTAYSRKQGEGP